MAPGNGRSAKKVLGRLKRLYPEPRHYLDFDGPFQLLVATILSAQCTDERVNLTTPALFEKYPDAAALAAAPVGDIEEAVRPTGFFRNKAKSIKGASEAIVREHGGEVPDDMESLTALPCIARKSANAILQHGFSKTEGIVVDTHVIRVAGRLGWTGEKDPEKIESDLTALFDRSDWKWLPFYLKSHGRAVCRAPRPRCGECGISAICPSAGKGGAR
jgi:endonuclease-3